LFRHFGYGRRPFSNPTFWITAGLIVLAFVCNFVYNGINYFFGAPPKDGLNTL
jgi:hypothetical protein